MKTALLDTNVLIALEDTSRQLSQEHAAILREARTEFDFYIHPAQLDDIRQDKDSSRRALLLSRIGQFKTIEQPPEVDEAYFQRHGWRCRNRNDYVDNTLLACVLEPVVNCLITEDAGIHKKAEKAGIGQHVLTLEEFGSLLIPDAEDPRLACIQESPCHTLDLDSTFFNSLREGYEGFDSWFLEKCAREQRRCWKVEFDGDIQALCIFKEENGEIIDNEGFRPNGKILKLCTFKVADGVHGGKVGERLLYKAFNYSQQHGIDFVYFTVNETRHPELVALADSFGFQKYGYWKDDRVIGKYLSPQNEADRLLAKADFNRRFYPSYKVDDSVRIFLVPIQKHWHERLFPDISDFFRDTLFGNFPEMYHPESNTIRKAYLSKSQIGLLEPGDLLLFYRSRNRQSVEVLASVVEVKRMDDVEEIYQFTKRRTVYSRDEISEMVAEAKNGVLVIHFDLLKYIDAPIGLAVLQRNGISVPQSIRSISKEQFNALIEVSL